MFQSSYAFFTTRDKLLLEKGEGCKAILKIIIDSLTLLGLPTTEINNSRSQLMKHRLPHHLK